MNTRAAEAPTGRRPSRFPLFEGPMMLWKSNQRCNFDCEYCFCSKEELSREHPLCGRFSPARIAGRFDGTGRSWTIFMTGGEPFLYPDFLELCRELARNHFLALNSNLSTSNVARFAGEIDPSRVRTINASFHERVLERSGKMGDFVSNVLRLQSGGFPVKVEYVAYPPLFGRIDRDIRALREAGVRTVNLKVYRGTFGNRLYPRDYSLDERALFLREGQDPAEIEFITEPFAFRGRPCRTGTDFLFMGMDGRIRRCPASSASYGDFLGGRYALDPRPRPCPYPRCGSPWVGREYAGGPKMSVRETLRETFREGIPFLLDPDRVRRAVVSFRDRRRLRSPQDPSQPRSSGLS